MFFYILRKQQPPQKFLTDDSVSESDDVWPCILSESRPNSFGVKVYALTTPSCCTIRISDVILPAFDIISQRIKQRILVGARCMWHTKIKRGLPFV